MFIKFSLLALRVHQLTLCTVVALMLAACGSDNTASNMSQPAPVIAGVAMSPPVITGTPPTSVEAKSKYQYIPHAADPNGRVLSYDITNKPAWLTFVEATGELYGTPEAGDVGTTAEIEIGISNGTSRATVGPFRIRIDPWKTPTPPFVPEPSTPPTIAGTPDAMVTAGQTYRFIPTITNPGRAALSFAIVNRPSWASFSTASGELSGTPNSANVGSFANVLISVTADHTTVSLPAFAINVVAPVNNAPTISGTPAASVMAGSGYAFTPSAADPEGHALRFSIRNSPSWASFSTATGQLSGTPRTTDVGSFANILISVTDGALTAALPAFAIDVQAAVNDAPTIAGTPTTSVVAGTSYSFKPTATDPSGNPLTFAIQGMPSWASFSSSSGQLSGTPAAGNVGSFTNIVISASDGSRTASLPAFSIEVKAPPDHAPVIGGAPPASIVAGKTYSFTPTASDPDGNPLTFSITHQPSWASFNASTGALSGTPTNAQIGTFGNIVITASDGMASAALPAFAVAVVAPPDRAPVIAGTPGTSVVAGSAYSFTPTASDPDGNRLTFSVSNLPSWATFAAASGALSGTPTAANIGTAANIVVSASDGTLTSSLPAFTITVAALPDPPPVISGTPATSVVAGAAYSFTPTASDPDGNRLTFSVSNLPSWATFAAASGALSGTPTAANVGTVANIVVRVSDGTLTTSLPAFSITVAAPANPPPTISGTPATSVNAGSAYLFTPAAADPNHNTLTFSIANLPSWASFNAQSGGLSGTPAVADAGTYANIGISVSDGSSTVSLATFSITVTQVANGSATLNWVAPTQNTDGSALTNLAGYHIMYGTSAGNLNQLVTIANPGLTTYVLGNLGPGTWYFSVNDYTTAGAVSAISNVVSKTL